MRRKKKCPTCHQWYQPHPQTYRRQIACQKELCRRQRRRRAWKRWSQKNLLYARSRSQKLRLWRREKGTVYMEAYRENHPAYVRRNRQLQHRRDAKRRFLVKPNDWDSIHIEKLHRIRILGHLVKPNDWTDVLSQQIDGLCRYLSWSMPLVKPNRIDRARSP